MGRPLPGIEVAIDEGELTVAPASVPTFFLGYLGEQRRSAARRTARWSVDGPPRRAAVAHRATACARRGRLALLRGAQRRRDRLRRLPHRAVRGGVGARGPPRRRRGRRRGGARRGARRGGAGGGRAARRPPPPSPELARELQEHVKRETAPYKYPRIVDFVEELPKTASGKVRRAELRDGSSQAPGDAAPGSADSPRARARPRSTSRACGRARRAQASGRRRATPSATQHRRHQVGEVVAAGQRARERVPARRSAPWCGRSRSCRAPPGRSRRTAAPRR